MRRFATRLGFFVAPFVVWYALELFVLPITAFTFRPWEALIVKSVSWTKIGPFYPNMHVVMESVGYFDHSSGKPNPIRKHEEWFTDENSYRNRPRPFPPNGYEVVLSGDSAIVGAFMDQKDILAEVLERDCNCPVYSVGSAGGYAYVDDDSFIRHPPKFFLRNIELNPNIDLNTTSGAFTFYGFQKRPVSSWPKWALILADRFQKQVFREFLRANVGITEIARWTANADALRAAASRREAATDMSRMAAVEDARPVKVALEETAVDRAEAATLKTAALLKAQGTQLIVLFMPWTDHAVYAPLIARLRAKGVLVVDFPPTAKWPKGYPDSFWQSADSHWTEEAVREVSRRILGQMHSKSKL